MNEKFLFNKIKTFNGIVSKNNNFTQLYIFSVFLIIFETIPLKVFRQCKYEKIFNYSNLNSK